MSLRDLIVNGSFETGTLTPWNAINAFPTASFSHSGFSRFYYWEEILIHLLLNSSQLMLEKVMK